MAATPRDAGATSPGPDAMSYTDLAHQVVAAVAPRELELFPEVTAAWLAGDLAGRRAGDRLGGSIGFGLDPSLTVLVVYTVLTEALGQVLGGAVETGWGRLRNRLRRGRRKPSPRLPVIVGDQAEKIRKACLAHALAAGVPKRRAELIADAVYGSLLRTLTEADECD